MIIYLATNKINGKMYIGQTIHDLNMRKKQHIYTVLNKKDNVYFHSAIRKYGIDNFEWSILHDNITTIDFLNRLEIFYIGYYDTYLGEGYNLNEGGRNALTPEETRKKISEAQLGKKNHMYGKTGESSPIYGIKRSVELKQKLSELWKGKRYGKDNPNARVVIINNRYFGTRKEAAEFVSITSSTIRYRILHKTKWLDYAYA